MATAAIGAEFPVVGIVCPMAVSATATDGCHVFERAAMTGVACNIDMCAVERKVGLQIVIESPDVPADRVVAGLAAVLEVATMRIVLLMAGDAVTISVREFLAAMTCVAFVLEMHAVQRESRQVMVEKHRVLPIDLGVAAFAGHAGGTLVRVLVEVA